MKYYLCTFKYDVSYTYGHSVVLLLNEKESKINGNMICVTSGHGNDSDECQVFRKKKSEVTEHTYTELCTFLNSSSSYSKELYANIKEKLQEQEKEEEQYCE